METVAQASRIDAAVVIRVAGNLDGETAPELTRVIQQAIAPGDRKMIMDLTEVRYISSAGLSSLLSAGKQMNRQGGELLICGVTGRLKDIFIISGIAALFTCFESSRDAIAHCSGTLP